MPTPGYYNDAGRDGDPNNNVSFLTDKCNALSIRLQQVEAQLFSERAEGSQRRLLCASPSHSTASTTHTFDPAWQHSHSRTSTADPRSSPRSRVAARQPSSHAPPPRAPWSPPAGFNGDRHRGDGPSRAVEADYDGSRRAGFLDDDDNNDDSEYICMAQGYYEAGENSTPRTNFVRARTGSESPSPDRGKAQQFPSSLRPGLASPGGYGGGSGWHAVPAVGGGARSVERAGRPGKKGAKTDEDALHCERVDKEIAHRFDIVADGMEKLDNIFSNAAQILEHRVHAITTISRSVSGASGASHQFQSLVEKFTEQKCRDIALIAHFEGEQSGDGGHVIVSAAVVFFFWRTLLGPGNRLQNNRGVRLYQHSTANIYEPATA